VGIRNLSPQLRNIADNQIDCGIADKKKFRNCDCGTSIFDFRNFATLSSFLPVPLISSPFSSAQDGFKITKNSFRTACFSGNQKLALKGQ
jgi:hypothetical protein